MIKDIELSIKDKNFELTKNIFNNIYNKINNSDFFNIFGITVVNDFDEFLEFLLREYPNFILNNIDIISYILLYAEKLYLNNNFYLNKNIRYETDNYKLVRDLIKCNNNNVVNEILLNFKIDNYNPILEEALKRENLEVLKTLNTLNIPKNNIQIPIFDLKKESKDFYHYLFFDFLEDKTNFQEQYYLFAFLIEDIVLFNKILDFWKVDELNKTNPKTIIRTIIENNKTEYLESILNNKDKFEFFSQEGNALHICLLLQNVDCLKILFSYDIFVNEFENNILTKQINEYGNFLDIARKLILFRNF